MASTRVLDFIDYGAIFLCCVYRYRYTHNIYTYIIHIYIYIYICVY